MVTTVFMRAIPWPQNEYSEKTGYVRLIESVESKLNIIKS